MLVPFMVSNIQCSIPCGLLPASTARTSLSDMQNDSNNQLPVEVAAEEGFGAVTCCCTGTGAAGATAACCGIEAIEALCGTGTRFGTETGFGSESRRGTEACCSTGACGAGVCRDAGTCCATGACCGTKPCCNNTDCCGIESGARRESCDTAEYPDEPELLT